jgi:hypothetical protein
LRPGIFCSSPRLRRPWRWPLSATSRTGG